VKGKATSKQKKTMYMGMFAMWIAMLWVEENIREKGERRYGQTD